MLASPGAAADGDRRRASERDAGAITPLDFGSALFLASQLPQSVADGLLRLCRSGTISVDSLSTEVNGDSATETVATSTIDGTASTESISSEETPSTTLDDGETTVYSESKRAASSSSVCRLGMHSADMPVSQRYILKMAPSSLGGLRDRPLSRTPPGPPEAWKRRRLVRSDPVPCRVATVLSFCANFAAADFSTMSAGGSSASNAARRLRPLHRCLAHSVAAALIGSLVALAVLLRMV